MAGCCDPRGCDRMFDERFAEHRAKRYRKSGLDRSQRHMVTFLESVGIEGRSVLEIGGGVGELQMDLLARGASVATNVELLPAYDGAAKHLAEELGVADRAHRVIGDIAIDPGVAESADLVLMHRVVCCYPDVEALLGEAARHTRAALVFTHPTYALPVRGAVRVANVAQRLLGREFRLFDHDPDLMTEVLRGEGLSVTHRRRGLVWQVIGAVRD